LEPEIEDLYQILGLGAVGSLIALILNANRKRVLLFDSKNELNRVKHIRAKEKLSEIYGKEIIFNSSNLLDASSCSTLIISKKYSDKYCKEVAQIIGTVSPEANVLLVQNGYGHIRDLRELLPNNLIIGMFSGLEIFWDAGELVLRQYPSNLHIPDSEAEFTNQLTADFASPLLRIQNGGSESEVIWNKLARWIPLSVITAVTRLPCGEALEIFPRPLLNLLIRETCNLAQAELGGIYDESEILGQLYNLPKRLTTSSMRDSLKGVRTELWYVLKDMETDLAKHDLSNSAVKQVMDLLD
jgi:ketopantoate reductase